MSYQNNIKITFLGDANSGKTSIIQKFVNHTFDSSSLSTIGASSHIKTIAHSNSEYTLNLWDTAGQERFKSISKMLYRDADAVVLVFDLAHRQTFESLESWYQSVLEISPQNVILIIVGNKIDTIKVDHTRGIMLDAKNFGSRINAPTLFVSAKTGDGIDSIFDKILEIYVQTRVTKNKSDDKNSFMLSETLVKTKKSGCC